MWPHGERTRTKLIKSKQKGKEKVALKDDIEKEFVCFFYKKKGHLKKNCAKYKRWLEKKGNLTSFVCYKYNMTDVNHNTW